MKTVIGIDPGRQGAISIVTGDKDKAAEVLYSITWKLPSRKSERFEHLTDLFRMLPFRPTAGVIEHPVLIFKEENGVKTVRNQKAYDTQIKDMETLENICQMVLGFLPVEIYPMTWKSFHGIKSNGTGKVQSMLKASKYRHCENHNESDAVLIGVYVFHKFGFEVSDLPEAKHGNESEYVKQKRNQLKEDLLNQFGADPLIMARKGR